MKTTLAAIVGLSLFACLAQATAADGQVPNGNPAARPGVNANGMPISGQGADANRAQPNQPQPSGLNPAGATGTNPYTGVPVGQPLQPNDLSAHPSQPEH